MTPQDSFASPGAFFVDQQDGDQTDAYRGLARRQGDLRAGHRHEERDVRHRGAVVGGLGCGPPHRATARRRAGRRNRRLGGALADLAPSRLRRCSREQHLRGRDRPRPGDRPRAPRRARSRRPTPPGSGRSRRRSSPRTPPASRCTRHAASGLSVCASGSDKWTASGGTPSSWRGERIELGEDRGGRDPRADRDGDRRRRGARRPRRRHRDRGGRPRPPAGDHARVPGPRFRVAVPPEGAARVRGARGAGGGDRRDDRRRRPQWQRVRRRDRAGRPRSRT